MTCLKNKVVLFLLAFIATLQTGLVFRTERLIKLVEGFEPVVIERVEYKTIPEPTNTPVLPRIDCPLDDSTQQMIFEKCTEYGVDFTLAMAVIFKESSFRPDVVSADGGDYGLMQINKINHKWLSKELGITNFLDPEQNVTAGLYMLSNLFEKYDDAAKVLMAYNMGEGGAKKLWNQGIYSSDYAEGVLQQTEIYKEEIQRKDG